MTRKPPARAQRPSPAAPTSAASQAVQLNKNGIALAAQNRLDEAVQNFAQAITLNPRDADAHNNLGNMLRAQGHLMEARACYQRALALNPNLSMAHNNLGLVLLGLGQPAQAAVSLRRALVLNKQNPDTLYNLGNALLAQGKASEALDAYRKALAKKPDFPEVLMNLGSLYAMQGDPAQAEPLFRTALAQRPGFTEAAYNLGNTLQDQGQWEEAINCFNDVLQTMPWHAKAQLNLAGALASLRRFTEADEAYAKAAALAPQEASVRVNRAMMMLKQGHLAEGFAAYDARWQTGQLTRPTSDAPLWDGGPLDGQTILLHAEQGLGDTLQFVRYAALVKERGAARILLLTPQPLVRLLKRMPALDDVIAEGDPLPPHDCLASLMDLPRLFGTTLETIPAPIPYLSPAPEDQAFWAARLAPLPGRKIGIVWAGNPRLDQPQSRAVDRKRSLPLAAFAPLAALPGIQWISLQKGPAAAQSQKPPDGLALTDWTADLNDFADTAALVAQLDLVVTVDTSVAHLAGALGKPVFMLSRYDGCWRWLLDRTDSPWYPSLRLFTQENFGHWERAIRSLTAAISSFVQADAA